MCCQNTMGVVDQLRAQPVAAQLAGVGGLAQQVQLVGDDFLVFGHHLAVGAAGATARAAAASARPARKCSRATSRATRSWMAGPQHLDHDLQPRLALLAMQPRGMHLGHRGRGQRPRCRTRRRPAPPACPARARPAPPLRRRGRALPRLCSRASSAAMSGGSRSGRVDSAWPNLMNTGPSSSSAARMRAPSGASNWRPARQPQALVHTMPAQHAPDAPQAQPLGARAQHQATGSPP